MWSCRSSGPRTRASSGVPFEMKRSDTDGFATFVAHDLTLRRAQQRIWTNASWKVEGYTAVVGGNGSGKSSTLAMLAGQLAPDAGALTMNVDGETISDTSWARRVALATPWCTPPQHLNLEQALQFHGTFRTSRTGQLGWGMLLDASGLKVGDNVPMNRWSSGQRQRLNLALAMGTVADVVLLDEPASNLDAQGMAWLHRVLEDIRRTTTVVVATNDPQREAPKALSLLEIEK